MSDLSKIFVGEGIQEVIVSYKGEDYKFKIKEISWARKTEIAAKVTKFDNKTGQSSIAVDKYNVEYLADTIVEAPWGNQPTRIMLLKLNPEFGTLLIEKLMPTISPDADIDDGEGLKKV